jgi:hypothetical protein
MHDSEAFATMRSSAHDGLNPRLAGWEWRADADAEELWLRVNPAVATGRVPIQAVVDDRAVLPPDHFRAERLSTRRVLKKADEPRPLVAAAQQSARRPLKRGACRAMSKEFGIACMTLASRQLSRRHRRIF